MQQLFNDPEFGNMLVNTRRGMRRVSIKWNNSHFVVNAPAGIGRDELAGIIAQNRAKLRAMQQNAQPAVAYSDGLVIPCLDFDITLGTQDRIASKLIFAGELPHRRVLVPQAMGFDSPNAAENISHALQVLARVHAPQVLLPMAQHIARQLGVQASGFELGRGKRKLGHCTRQGVIQLSHNVVFLPQHLAAYIVCHELAHLTHFNHSADFHQLVNRYTGGTEKALERELKAFRWPILR